MIKLVSIIIPVFNEVDAIEKLVENTQNLRNIGLNFEYEIIIVDDGSTDGTGATLKEIRSMLLGDKITIHTDHKNLTFDNLLTQRILRWLCYIEEYSPTIKYIKGQLNVIANTFSHMGLKEDLTTTS